VFDAPGIDVYLNGDKAVTNLEYKGLTPRISLAAGKYSVKITRTGDTAGLLDTELTLEGGKSYIVSAVGRLENVSTMVLEDDLSKLEAGKARVRLIHTSPDTPAVDIALQGGQILVTNLGFAEASGYLTVDAGTISLELRPAGTTTVALTVPNVQLEAGTVYSAFVVGTSAGPPGLSPVVVSDKVAVAEALPASGGPEATPPDTVPVTGEGDPPLEVLVVVALLASVLILSGISLRKEQGR
jgi:hypothetical protein